MLVVFASNILILAFLYLYSYKKMHYGLAIGVFLFFFIFAIRKDYGNDYSNYLDIFNRFSSMPFEEAIDSKYSFFEIGWRFLCSIFSEYGFNSLVIFCHAIISLSLFLVCKYCIPRELALFVVFVYLFTPDFMLVQLSMMREGLALSLILIGVALYLKRNNLLYLLGFSGCAYLFHFTSIVFFVFIIPLLLYRRYLYKYDFVRTIIVLFIGSIFVTGILFSKFDEITAAMDSFSKYDNYLGRKDGMTFGIGNLVEFLLMGFPAFLSYKYIKDKNQLLLFQMFLLSFLLVPMSFRSVIFQRITLYFTIFSVCVLPLSFAAINKLVVKRIWGLLYILFTLYRFTSFFYSPIYGEAYSTYHTIFD